MFVRMVGDGILKLSPFPPQKTVFARCVALAQGRHGRTPFARIIGWGISAEEDGAPALLKSSSTNSDIN
jgi:hypothetical protein